MEREALVETNAGMRGLGWLPDLPDVRDLTPEQPQITAMLEQTSVLKAQEALEAPPEQGRPEAIFLADRRPRNSRLLHRPEP
jgi:hypothetical protein